jgi:hypothetical protein
LKIFLSIGESREFWNLPFPEFIMKPEKARRREKRSLVAVTERNRLVMERIPPIADDSADNEPSIWGVLNRPAFDDVNRKRITTSWTELILDTRGRIP